MFIEYDSLIWLSESEPGPFKNYGRFMKNQVLNARLREVLFKEGIFGSRLDASILLHLHNMYLNPESFPLNCGVYICTMRSVTRFIKLPGDPFQRDSAFSISCEVCILAVSVDNEFALIVARLCMTLD
jgi:hypothetical protein